MLVEGDRVPDALASHQDDARAVGEAVRLVGASLEEGPGRPFVHGRHAEPFDNGRIEEGPPDRDGSPMPEAGLGECHGLVEHVGRGDQTVRGLGGGVLAWPPWTLSGC